MLRQILWFTAAAASLTGGYAFGNAGFGEQKGTVAAAVELLLW